jgi:serine/threonine-protein kinase
VVGKIYGTPEYISPEQGLNPDVDERADLYSVGVILYELLAGKLPFEGDTAYAIILAHQNQIPPEIPEIDARLHKIVRKAMEKRPVDRYQTAFEFQEDLRKWLDHQRHDFMQDSRPQRTHVGFPLTQAPEPVGLSEASETAPPVQIFSRTRRRRHDPTPHHPVARAPKTEDPPVTAVKKPVVLNEQPIIDPRDEKAQGSVAASIVTGVFILIVLGVVIYMTVLT